MPSRNAQTPDALCDMINHPYRTALTTVFASTATFATNSWIARTENIGAWKPSPLGGASDGTNLTLNNAGETHG